MARTLALCILLLALLGANGARRAAFRRVRHRHHQLGATGATGIENDDTNEVGWVDEPGDDALGVEEEDSQINDHWNSHPTSWTFEPGPSVEKSLLEVTAPEKWIVAEVQSIILGTSVGNPARLFEWDTFFNTVDIVEEKMDCQLQVVRIQNPAKTKKEAVKRLVCSDPTRARWFTWGEFPATWRTDFTVVPPTDQNYCVHVRLEPEFTKIITPETSTPLNNDQPGPPFALCFHDVVQKSHWALKLQSTVWLTNEPFKWAYDDTIAVDRRGSLFDLAIAEMDIPEQPPINPLPVVNIPPLGELNLMNEWVPGEALPFVHVHSPFLEELSLSFDLFGNNDQQAVNPNQVMGDLLPTNVLAPILAQPIQTEPMQEDPKPKEKDGMEEEEPAQGINQLPEGFEPFNQEEFQRYLEQNDDFFLENLASPRSQDSFRFRARPMKRHQTSAKARFHAQMVDTSRGVEPPKLTRADLNNSQSFAELQASKHFHRAHRRHHHSHIHSQQVARELPATPLDYPVDWDANTALNSDNQFTWSFEVEGNINRNAGILMLYKPVFVEASVWKQLDYKQRLQFVKCFPRTKNQNGKSVMQADAPSCPPGTPTKVIAVANGLKDKFQGDFDFSYFEFCFECFEKATDADAVFSNACFRKKQNLGLKWASTWARFLHQEVTGDNVWEVTHNYFATNMVDLRDSAACLVSTVCRWSKNCPDSAHIHASFIPPQSTAKTNMLISYIFWMNDFTYLPGLLETPMEWISQFFSFPDTATVQSVFADQIPRGFLAQERFDGTSNWGNLKCSKIALRHNPYKHGRLGIEFRVGLDWGSEYEFIDTTEGCEASRTALSGLPNTKGGALARFHTTLQVIDVLLRPLTTSLASTSPFRLSMDYVKKTYQDSSSSLRKLQCEVTQKDLTQNPSTSSTFSEAYLLYTSTDPNSMRYSHSCVGYVPEVCGVFGADDVAAGLRLMTGGDDHMRRVYRKLTLMFRFFQTWPGTVHAQDQVQACLNSALSVFRGFPAEVDAINPKPEFNSKPLRDLIKAAMNKIDCNNLIQFLETEKSWAMV